MTEIREREREEGVLFNSIRLFFPKLGGMWSNLLFLAKLCRSKINGRKKRKKLAGNRKLHQKY